MIIEAGVSAAVMFLLVACNSYDPEDHRNHSDITEYHTEYLANNPENYHTRAPVNVACKTD